MTSNHDDSNDEPTLDDLSAFSEIGDKFQEFNDPLKEFDTDFQEMELDPVEIYIDNVLWGKDVVERTLKQRESVIRHWIEHMGQFDRHAVCPNAAHVAQLIQSEVDTGNEHDTIMRKLRVLLRMFDYFSDDMNLPHGRGESKGYNPVKSAITLKSNELKKSKDTQQKKQHEISIEKLRHIIRGIKNTLHRSVVGVQFKYGKRSGQVSNIQIPDIQLSHDGLSELHPTLGSHHRLDDIDCPAIYIPSRYERPGNKSEKSIVMPIDAETEQLFVQYLRIRPPTEKPWLFINPSNFNQLNPEYINSKIWHTHFRPEYDSTDVFKPVSSHYGRHRFNTFWQKERDIKDEYLKYMRGDEGTESMRNGADFYDYVHTYFGDVKDVYLSQIYKLNLV